MSDDLCITLQADYTQIPSTSSYSVSSIPFSPVIPLNQGTALIPTMPSVGNAVDDKFSAPIDMGFSFCFFDGSYDQIVIGTNGILTFSLSEAGADCPSGIAATNPSPLLIDLSVFGVQHDMIFYNNDESEIYYTTIGTAPCRQFVVSYYEARLYGCPERSNIQVVFSEFTNEVEVHVQDKPLMCDNGRVGLSLLGIMNGAGTLGYSPPNRNTGEWSAHNEAWQFTPTGPEMAIVQWFDDQGELVGVGDQITVCPTRNNVYTAEVHYQSCENYDLVVTDSVPVNFQANYPMAENNEIFICDSDNSGTETIILSNYNDFISLNNPLFFTFSYHLTAADAQAGVNPISQINIDSATTVFVHISSISNPACYNIFPINFSFDIAIVGNLTRTICDNNNDGIEANVNLQTHVNSILSGIDFIDYSIYATELDASTQQNAITTADVTTESQFWVFLNISENCQQVIGPITFNFHAAPTIPDIPTIQFEACDIDFNRYEPFDWDSEIRSLINVPANTTLSVHNSYAAAVAGSAPQTQISDLYPTVYVRFVNANGCFTVVPLNLEVEFYGVDALDIDVNICFDGTEDISIDLSDYGPGMLIDPLEGVSITYHDSAESANSSSVSNIDPQQLLTDDGHLVIYTFYVRFELSPSCYSVRVIRIRLVHPIPMQNPIDVCDIFNDGEEESNLTIYDSYILGSQVGTVAYFLNEQDALNGQNALDNYFFTDPVTLWVAITSYDCTEIYPIDFQLVSVPPFQNMDIPLHDLCDVDEEGYVEIDLTFFNSSIYPGSEEVEIEYYQNYDQASETFTNLIPDPSAFSLNASQTIYAKIMLENTVCYSVAVLNLDLSFISELQLLPQEMYQCDYEFDLNEIFDMSEAIPAMFSTENTSELSQYQVSYHQTMEFAEEGSNPLPVVFSPNSAEYNVYVRFENQISGCYFIEVLTLYTIGAPKPVSGEYLVCDRNLNGMPDLDLNVLDAIVMEETEGYTFTYHLSESDALSNHNALDPSVEYEAAPFPSQIWVRVENIIDCFDVNYVNMTVGEMTELPISNFRLTECDLDNDGFAEFEMTEIIEASYDPTLYQITYFESLEQIQNWEDPIDNPSQFTNTTPHSQQIIVKIEREGFCPGYVTLTIDVIPTPQVTADPVVSCPGESIDLIAQVHDGSNYTFQWYDPQNTFISDAQSLYNITETGEYTLIVTNVDYPECQKTIPVTYSHYLLPVIQDIEETDNSATVHATGSYPMEYSIDGITWQHSPVFSPLEPGLYTFYVRYVEQLCEGEPKQGAIFQIFNVVTPNGDGYNDHFRILDLHIFDGAESRLQIFDRYGKLIYEQTSNTEFVWDGTYLGRVVPTTDYWYIFTVPDGRQLSGHITVRNRYRH